MLIFVPEPRHKPSYLNMVVSGVQKQAKKKKKKSKKKGKHVDVQRNAKQGKRQVQKVKLTN